MVTKKVTLKNGTVLEVGNTYEFDKYERGDYFTMLFIGDYKMAYKYNNSGDEVAMSIDKNLMIIPYTPPTPQKEWKTFLIEVMHHKTGTFYKFPILAESEENARKIHPKAISIKQIDLNIEKY